MELGLPAQSPSIQTEVNRNNNKDRDIAATETTVGKEMGNLVGRQCIE
jgi:hypothetical protein